MEDVPEFIRAASPGISGTLEERGDKYGKYFDQAEISQGLQEAMQDTKNWTLLPADMRDALQMISVKISRILNGDYFHADSWHDIQGYAKLVEDRINQETEK